MLKKGSMKTWEPCPPIVKGLTNIHAGCQPVTSCIGCHPMHFCVTKVCPQGSPTVPVPAAVPAAAPAVGAPCSYTPAAVGAAAVLASSSTRCSTRCGRCIEHGVPQRVLLRVPQRVQARQMNPVGHRTKALGVH